MPPRRIVRWKSFWLGIVVLVFLGWAWMSTRPQMGTLYYIADRWIYAVGSGSGSVHFTMVPYAPMPVEWGFDSTPLSSENLQWFAPAFENVWEWEGSTNKGGYTSVAYWVVVLAFLALWVGFLAWRWGRMRKVMSAGHEMPGSGIASKSSSARTKGE